MPREEHSAPIYKWRLLPELQLIMSYLPKGHWLPPCPGFIPPMARFVHDNINSEEICRVFVLRCQSASNLTHPVLFHRVTCHMHFIWSFKSQSYIHTFMHPQINTFIYSHIQAYTTHTYTHTYTHHVNSHMIAWVTQSLVQSYLINSVINSFKW